MVQLVSNPAEKVRLPSLDSTESNRVTGVLRTPAVEILHIFVRADEDIPTHEPQGEVIVHCLTGRVGLKTDHVVHQLAAGEILYLRGNQPFSIKACEPSSLLMTILEPQTGGAISLIGQPPGTAN
jgi:quercetin dioxygenase-like cupin family protein